MTRAHDPVHPATVVEPNGAARGHLGLTVREYVAAHALAGLCAAPDTSDWTPRDHASTAVRMADALLAALAASPVAQQEVAP